MEREILSLEEIYRRRGLSKNNGTPIKVQQRIPSGGAGGSLLPYRYRR